MYNTYIYRLNFGGIIILLGLHKRFQSRERKPYCLIEMSPHKIVSYQPWSGDIFTQECPEKMQDQRLVDSNIPPLNGLKYVIY